MKQIALHIIITIYFAIFLLACPASAGIESATQFTLDLTKTTDLAKKATWSSDAKDVRLTGRGLTLPPSRKPLG